MKLLKLFIVLKEFFLLFFKNERIYRALKRKLLLKATRRKYRGGKNVLKGEKNENLYRLRKSDKRRLFADLSQLRSKRLLRLRREKQENMPVLLFGFGFYRLTDLNDRQYGTDGKKAAANSFAAAFSFFLDLRRGSLPRCGKDKTSRKTTRENYSVKKYVENIRNNYVITIKTVYCCFL